MIAAWTGRFSTRVFHNLIADAIDPIGVVAETADQRIGPGTAVQDIGRRIAGQAVGGHCRSQSMARTAGQDQILHAAQGRQTGHARPDGIGPSPAFSVTTSRALSSPRVSFPCRRWEGGHYPRRRQSSRCLNPPLQDIRPAVAGEGDCPMHPVPLIAALPVR